MAILMDGKAVSAAVREEVAREAAALTEQYRQPCLAVILVGDDPASEVYVRNKHKACEACGIRSLQYHLPADTDMPTLLALVQKLNNDLTVDGILCQLPLPQGLSEKEVILAIDPKKDVDAFHPVNTGRIMSGDYGFLPCTPAGIMELLHRYGVTVKGKNCVVIGRSNIVGKPMAMLLLNESGTVSICHSKTEDLAFHTRNADILVAAVGKPRFVTADMVKDGAAVIDVGINRMPNGKLCGDVDFEAVQQKAAYITPVPGGVGPMTIAMLLKNTITATRNHWEEEK